MNRQTLTAKKSIPFLFEINAGLNFLRGFRGHGPYKIGGPPLQPRKQLFLIKKKLDFPVMFLYPLVN